MKIVLTVLVALLLGGCSAEKEDYLLTKCAALAECLNLNAESEVSLALRSCYLFRGKEFVIQFPEPRVLEAISACYVHKTLTEKVK